MKPDEIGEAIAFGTGSKNLHPYSVHKKSDNWGPLIGEYTTPFLRVALAANLAKKRGQPFSEKDVTVEMTAPEIQIYAALQSVRPTDPANIVTIVLMPYNSKDPSQEIHPTRVEQASEQIKELYGYTGKGKGLVAAFPLDVWNENKDVLVVLDAEVLGPSGKSVQRAAVKARIDLKRIR